MIVLLYVLLAIVALGAVSLGASGHVVKQFERGVVFRFGRVRPATLGPGLALVVPFVDRLQKVNMQIITLPVPARRRAGLPLCGGSGGADVAALDHRQERPG